MMQPPPTGSLSNAAEPSRWEEPVSAADATRQNEENLSILPSNGALTVFFSLYSYAFAPLMTHSLKFTFAHTCSSLTTFIRKMMGPVNDQYLR